MVCVSRVALFCQRVIALESLFSFLQKSAAASAAAAKK
jgi:hypothetical protein